METADNRLSRGTVVDEFIDQMFDNRLQIRWRDQFVHALGENGESIGYIFKKINNNYNILAIK